MSVAFKQTAAQKRYAGCVAAARSWATSTSADTLRAADGARVARSYGISPADASLIIADARRERRI